MEEATTTIVDPEDGNEKRFTFDFRWDVALDVVADWPWGPKPRLRARDRREENEQKEKEGNKKKGKKKKGKKKKKEEREKYKHFYK